MAQHFLSVYQDNVSAVYGFLAYRTSSREQAEDLTQLTFERALKAWARFDVARASPRTWLLSIARNALIDEARRRSSRDVSLDGPAGEGVRQGLGVAGPGEALPGVAPEIADALSRLARREREALALRFGADLDSRQIAELLETTVANVHQITSRALRKMRAELAAQGETALSDSVAGG